MAAQLLETVVLPRVNGRHRDRALASARKCRAIQDDLCVEVLVGPRTRPSQAPSQRAAGAVQLRPWPFICFVLQHLTITTTILVVGGVRRLFEPATVSDGGIRSRRPGREPRVDAGPDPQQQLRADAVV